MTRFAALPRQLDKFHKLFKSKEAHVDLETVMSGNVWVVNSYHRAVIIATEALDGTRNMSNHCENESTMRSFLWNILVNLFYLLVQGPLVNIQRTSDALGKGTGTDLRDSVISMSGQAIRALSKCLPEKCPCMCQIMWLKLQSPHVQ